MGLMKRVRQGWNVFRNKDPQLYKSYHVDASYTRPDKIRSRTTIDRSIVTSVYNRIALDVSSIELRHCQTDDDGRYCDDIDSYLNDCLKLEANIDQSTEAFIIDAVLSMFDEGVVALVPTVADEDPTKTMSFDPVSIRVGKILQWRPQHILVKLYNEDTGKDEDVWVPKRTTCIVENPFYSVVNQPNGTMQRLIRKLNLLDVTDEQTASGKLDLIIQLPYSVKNSVKEMKAKERKSDIEDQLRNSRYGIAYLDSTEKITQLNRPVENNLMPQIEYLTSQMFSQLGMTQSILDGTADESTMINYYSRTIEPIINAIAKEMKRKWLSKTARTRGHSIMYFRNPFKLVPVKELADISDSFTRNEITSSNEIRQFMGLKPSKDPKADKLIIVT